MLKGAKTFDDRPGASIPPLDFEKLRESLVEKHGPVVREVDVMSSALYPKVLDDYMDFHDKYGPVNTLNTRLFLKGPKVPEEFEVNMPTLYLYKIGQFQDITPKMVEKHLSTTMY